ncbi:1-acyl-sn-glycerol-3-phosphate acyltransferase [Elizabethkingia sp. JS20170427COW]|uniref:1-acyl-sn-glycerol-3-phosphate acyltransferase n=1 Tax=Elizabethkingia sp. JS20170427COW TaxID=2583851 RepID=UPI001110C6A1|nr:1-acyl-sn-glycerol-3-phosphate acyltransferase [Elizabethkingia sp. JS20170427COW]QCX53940.1 glycerol acyltransferase [Elizabethkingia sp. JS20170427COW]
MKKVFGSLLLKILGWKIQLDGDVNNLDRCVLVVAPHTSNWDYILGIATYWTLGKKLKVIIKDQHTKAFYGGIVKNIGAIGIDRSKKNDLVHIVAEEFKKEDFSLVITPEGSRSYAKKWRLGFYHMAKTAQVPIVLASGDFKEKKVKIGYKIPLEDIENKPLEEILDTIQDYFKDIHAKYPENFNPKIY